MVSDPPSSVGGAGSVPDQGPKIPHDSRPKSQNIKQKRCCNKFNKDFKIGPQQQQQQKSFLKKKKRVRGKKGKGLKKKNI